ncbi:hypothetical protein J7M07_06325 [bacterium]|nr:hypothetical protein [bacterium]
MRLFLNAITVGVGLVAGVISIFQNVPFTVFVKRVGMTLVIFYMASIVLDFLWKVGSVNFSRRVSEADLSKGKEEE